MSAAGIMAREGKAAELESLLSRLLVLAKSTRARLQDGETEGLLEALDERDRLQARLDVLLSHARAWGAEADHLRGLLSRVAEQDEHLVSEVGQAHDEIRDSLSELEATRQRLVAYADGEEPHAPTIDLQS